MSVHNFPMHNLKLDRFKKGLCTNCGNKNPMNDRRLGCFDALCPKCRKEYNQRMDK